MPAHVRATSCLLLPLFISCSTMTGRPLRLTDPLQTAGMTGKVCVLLTETHVIIGRLLRVVEYNTLLYSNIRVKNLTVYNIL